MAIENDYKGGIDLRLMRGTPPLFWLLDITSYPIHAIKYLDFSIEISVHERDFWGKPTKLIAHLLIEFIQECDFAMQGEFGYVNLGFRYKSSAKYAEHDCELIMNYVYFESAAETLIEKWSSKLKEQGYYSDPKWEVPLSQKINHINRCVDLLKYFELPRFKTSAVG